MRGTLRDRPDGPEEDRLFDLMRDRAVHGLDDDGMRELNRLAAVHQDLDVECYDRAAAALDIVFADRRCAPMPKELEARIAAAAPRVIGSVRAEQGSITSSRMRDDEAAREVASTPTWIAWSGWIAALAAAIVAMVAWTRSPASPSPTLVTRELRAAVDAAPDHLVLPWTRTEDVDGRNVSGEVHWSTVLQRGYMRFRGLPANDPTLAQYQLWIFDEPRGSDHPVDGGVFDVADEDVFVPIDAKIRVSRPSMFAVTAELPGGVVVSRRERIVSLAKP